jgi:hypothetical protein
MQSRAAKPTTDIRHSPSAIQRGQHADLIDHQERSRLSSNAEVYRGGKAGGGSTSLDCLDVSSRGLMGYKDEPGLRMASAHGREGPEQNRLVTWPGGTRHHGRRAAPEAEQGFFRPHTSHFLHNAVEAGVAQDLNAFRCYP